MLTPAAFIPHIHTAKQTYLLRYRIPHTCLTSSLSPPAISHSTLPHLIVTQLLDHDTLIIIHSHLPLHRFMPPFLPPDQSVPLPPSSRTLSFPVIFLYPRHRNTPSTPQHSRTLSTSVSPPPSPLRLTLHFSPVLTLSENPPYRFPAFLPLPLPSILDISLPVPCSPFSTLSLIHRPSLPSPARITVCCPSVAWSAGKEEDPATLNKHALYDREYCKHERLDGDSSPTREATAPAAPRPSTPPLPPTTQPDASLVHLHDSRWVGGGGRVAGGWRKGWWRGGRRGYVSGRHCQEHL